MRMGRKLKSSDKICAAGVSSSFAGLPLSLSQAIQISSLARLAERCSVSQQSHLGPLASTKSHICVCFLFFFCLQLYYIKNSSLCEGYWVWLCLRSLGLARDSPLPSLGYIEPFHTSCSNFCETQLLVPRTHER